MHSVPLLKYLTTTGIGSRRKMADIITQGRVRVNGLVTDDFKYPIHPSQDHITIDRNEVVADQHRPLYLILNKPAGIITTTHDEKNRATILDVIPEKYKSIRLYPVGRLDRDSTGLLLITNDGDLTYQLTHPKYEHEKEYLVAIDGTLKREEKQKLEDGLDLSDGRTSPSRIRSVRKKHPYNYSITIHEGKNRQVRRMFAQLGYEIRALKRIRIGNIRIGHLKEGEMRELTEDEVTRLLSGTQV